MKKKITVLLLCLFLVACQNNADNSTVTKSSISENEKNLIVYFSVMETDGVDTVSGASRVVKDGKLYGNTEYVATVIQAQTNGDLFQIQTEQEYPTTHQPLLEFAHKEMEENARPKLISSISNMDEYTTIYIGYPTWNADLPMPLYTFLEEYDLSGKTIIPFNTHGGSGFANTIQTISDLQKDAIIDTDGLSISRNNVADSEEEIAKWIKKKK